MKRRSGFRSPIECRPLTKVPSRAMRSSAALAHARHELHVEHHVGAVGDFDAAAREGRIDRAHAVRHDVHRAALHAAGKQGIHLFVRFVRGHPMLFGSRVFPALGADERDMLDPRHVGWIGTVEITSWKAFLIERQQFLLGYQLALHGLELRVAAVAPMDPVGLGQPRHLVDPTGYIAVEICERRDMLRCCCHETPQERSVLDFGE